VNQEIPGIHAPVVHGSSAADRSRERSVTERSFRDAETATVLTDLVAGMVGLALRGLSVAVRPASAPDVPLTRTRLLLGAGLTVPIAVARRSAAVAVRLGGALRPLARFAAERTPLAGPIQAGRQTLWELGEREWAAQDRRERFAAAVIGRVVELAAAAVVDRLDLDAIIARVDLVKVVDRIDVNAVVAKADLDAVVNRIDLDAVIARVDLDAVVDRLDLNAVVDRLDLNAVVDRVDINAVVDRVDINAIVDRVDINAIVDRVDINAIVSGVDIDAIAAGIDIQAIVDRVDVAALTNRVLDELDLGQIVRESTGSMTSETVDAIRYQGMNADRLVSRIVDRILRRAGRDTTLGAQPDQADDQQTAPDDRQIRTVEP
jgi:hypothetical protein